MLQLESFTVAPRIINHLVVIFSSHSREAMLYWTAAPGSCTPQEGHIPIFGRAITVFCFCRGLFFARPKKGRRMEQMPTLFTPFPWVVVAGGASFSSTQLRRESGQNLTSLLSLLHKWLSNILELCRAVSHNPQTLPNRCARAARHHGKHLFVQLLWNSGESALAVCRLIFS